MLWVCPIRDSWSSLPHVYSQVNWDCYDYEPKCYVWTHTSTYGNCGAVLGDLYTVEKIGGARFRCPGYFINHLVISIPGPHRWLRKFFQTQNGASPLRLCQQPPYCVYRVYRATMCHSTHYVIPYPLYDHISLLVMCVYVCVSGRRRRLVKAI